MIIDSGTVYGNIKNAHEKEELLADYQSFIAALDKKSFTAAVAEPDLELESILPDEMLIYPLDDIRPVFENDLSSICKNVKYIGVSNKEASAKGGENLPALFAQASKTGTLVHAFGTGSRKLLTKYPFYSANTSSWRTGSRYLNTYLYEGPGRGLRLYQPTDKKDPLKTEKELHAIRRRQKNLIKIRQAPLYEKIDWEELFGGDSWEVDNANLSQWVMYQQDLELLPHNKYFLTDNQRTDINMRKKDLLGNQQNTEFPSPGPQLDSTPADLAAGIDKESSPNIEGVDISNNDSSEGEIVDADVIEDGQIVPYEEQGALPGTASRGLPVRTRRITPVDERMRQVRQCDFCVLAGRCPKYAPASPCSYGFPPEAPTYDHNDMDQIIKEQFADVMALQMDRVQQLALEEKMDASGANKDLTANLKLWAEIISLYREAISNQESLKIEAKGPNVIDMFTRTRGH